MRRRTLVLAWAALAVGAQVLPGLLGGGAARAEPPSASHDPVLIYVIRTALDPKSHVLACDGDLTWRNTTSVAVPDFHLHLYLNAFRDAHSTYLRESLGEHRGAKFDFEHPGSIEVTSFRTAAGEELVGRAGYASCDDANPDDRTVMVLPLPEPIAPGASATFHLAWTSKLPKAFARTGYGGEYHMAAQWFPKPGVFEEVPGEGAMTAEWNCHQYHGSSEFFADYGRYDVAITVPRAYEGKVGATGQRVDTKVDEAKGTVTYRHEAVDVHDFAWVCDTDFEVFTYQFPGGDAGQKEAQERAAALLGKDPVELNLPPVHVTVLLQPEHKDQAERHRVAVFHALAHMGFWFGPYPYSTLTVVDPDHRADDTGGMEYPTLITGGTDYVARADGLDPEGVLVHEFGHQFFYGLVGNNEFEDAWMDEGLNTYGTARTLVAAYPRERPAVEYAGLHVRGEKPLPWKGVIGGLGVALPHLPTEDWRIPWGKIGFIGSAGRWLGLSPPDDLPLLPEDVPDAGTLAYLREAPFLTLLPIRPMSVYENERTWVAKRPVVDPIAPVKAWEYMDRRSYGVNSYGRTAAAVRTLEGLVGEDVVLRGMRAYVDAYRYRHPKPEDFFHALVQAAEAKGHPGLRDTIRTLFETADAVDYGIGGIEVWDPDEKHGEGGKGAGKGEEAPADPLAPKRKPESTVLLRRYGDARLPVEVRVAFEGGTERRVRWEVDGRVTSLDGQPAPLQPIAPGRAQGRWTKIRFVNDTPAIAAETDPRRLLQVERDRTNDGLVPEPEGPNPVLPLSVRLLGWVEMMSSFYGGL